MASPPGSYRGAFWETDFVSQTGFETVVNHIKDGQRSCKWLEDYLKGRAKAEEEYSKALFKICRVERGTTECATMRKTLDEFRAEAETEATLHATLAQKFAEEITSLTEFREKQREERKRNEDTVHRAHKNKSDLYKKMHSCKNSYENKCKAAEKAESDAEKLKFGNKHKDLDKAKKSAAQARASAAKADDDYRNSVASVESARQVWAREHADACDVMQKLDEERIQFLRNAAWVFSNLCSDLCVRLDESRERIRATAEQCDHVADVREFVSLKSTCIAPLQAVEYTPYGSGESVHAPSPPTAALPDLPGRPPLTNGSDSHSHSHVYQLDESTQSMNGSSGGSGGGVVFKALYDYAATKDDELTLLAGDTIRSLPKPNVDPGWMYGANSRTHQQGMVPCNYVVAAS